MGLFSGETDWVAGRDFSLIFQYYFVMSLTLNTETDTDTVTISQDLFYSILYLAYTRHLIDLDCITSHVLPRPLPHQDYVCTVCPVEFPIKPVSAGRDHQSEAIGPFSSENVEWFRPPGCIVIRAECTSSRNFHCKHASGQYTILFGNIYWLNRREIN